MDPPPRPVNSLFEVYLRLRPLFTPDAERFLDVEECDEGFPKHITIKPKSDDHRKRAVERFAFTRVFEEEASQLDLFKGTGVLPLVEGVLGAHGGEGRDGLLATLGVTGSGKSHTILGSKTQRGMTQLTLDLVFQTLTANLIPSTSLTTAFPSIAASDVSEAQLFPGHVFLDSIYGDGQSIRGSCSRAQTPMPVESPFPSPKHTQAAHHQSLASPSPSPKQMLPGLYPSLTKHLHNILSPSKTKPPTPTIRPVMGEMSFLTRNVAKKTTVSKDASFLSLPSTKQRIPRPSALPQSPAIEDIHLPVDAACDYVVVISMFEVYNDRIFDLLAGNSPSGTAKIPKRRALLFKSTEMSPERKVVAGLRKIICSDLQEALMVLETGLVERRVAGTGSNAASSRSHGFFCIEVKKRNKIHKTSWSTSTLTIVDLAGSERARQAKTAGATLAEAGKINESLMYLGQCMQMQSDNQESAKQNIVPFRQCKLTELLFSNSFPSASVTAHHHHYHLTPRNPQKGIMIVTADPVGDFNATSQILRYSALAREITVPRIPSITSTILCGPSTSRNTNSGRNSPFSSSSSTTNATTTTTITNEDLESAYKEISNLSNSIEILQLRLAEEQSRREAAESSWLACEERMSTLECEIREECNDEMECRLDSERRRWKAAWDEEADYNDVHLDRKIEILTNASANANANPGVVVDVRVDSPDVLALGDLEDRVRVLVGENFELRRRLEGLDGDGMARSPVKKQRVLKSRKWELDENGFASP